MTGAPDFEPKPPEEADAPFVEVAAAHARSAAVAQTVAATAEHLPARTREDLYALLGHKLASPSPRQMREAKLGLIYELIAAGDGELPGTRRYLEERERRAAQGEHWPTPTDLQPVYGPWLVACLAAHRLWKDGMAARVPHRSVPRPQETVLPQRHDVIRGLHSFRLEFDHWPTPWEYDQWRIATCASARHTGSPDPRLPTLTRITALIRQLGPRAAHRHPRVVRHKGRLLSLSGLLFGCRGRRCRPARGRWSGSAAS
jgi:hypothetical protein